jgi:hypothetical protein
VDDIIIIVWVAQCLICAVYAGTIGGAKGRSPARYFLHGLLFGVLGLIFTAGMPTREEAALEVKRDSDEEERFWLKREKIAHERKQARLDKKQAKLEKKEAKRG